MADTSDRIGLFDMLRAGPRNLPGVHRVGYGAGWLAAARYLSRLSIGRLLELRARLQPGHPALRFEGREYSYGEFNAIANQYARALANGGVGAGDTVAVLLENRPQTLFVVAALAKLGAIAAMCNTNQRGAVLIHSLTTASASAVVVGVELQQAFDDVRDQVDVNDDAAWFVADEDTDAVPENYRDLPACAAAEPVDNLPQTRKVDKKQPCFYIFTSGTTGLPKASVMSHSRWIKAGAGFGQSGMRLSRSDVLYCCLPLYHNNALTVSWSSVLIAGGTFALARKFSASRFFDDIRAMQATAFCYVGELCRYLLRQPPDSSDSDHDVRVMVGNGLRPDIWDEFKQRFGIPFVCEFYGASEGNMVFVNGFNMDRTAGFCPMPFAVVECDTDSEQPIRNDKGWMQRVAKGDVGLLLTEVTEMAPFEGYTDDAESSKKLFQDVFKEGDSYFNTGDLVRAQGMRHIAFVDRLGDTFRWKGENVATTEVEKALNTHDQIAESVVYGVEVTGADGRAGMAAITPQEGGGEIDWDGLARHLKNALPAYAVPVFIRVRSSVEVTGTFKHRKVDLKKQGYAETGEEPVYVLLPKAASYTALDEPTWGKIDSGEISL